MSPRVADAAAGAVVLSGPFDVSDGSTGVVTLSPRAFRATWCCVIAYHLFNAWFAAVLAIAHLLMTVPAIHQNMWMLALDTRILTVGGWSFLAVAMLHIGVVIRHVWQSVRYRRLSFGYESIGGDSLTAVVIHPLSSTCCSSWRASGFVGQLRRLRTSLQQFLDSSDHDEFSNFELVFQTRQCVEILFQTYQADQISRQVVRRDINVIVVAVVVFNCIHTPLLDVLFSRAAKKRQTAFRVIALQVADILLDFSIAVCIPLLLIMPHGSEFDSSGTGYPTEYANNDVWAATIVGEARQVLVTSWTDYVATLSPHLLGIVGLRLIKARLRRRFVPGTVPQPKRRHAKDYRGPSVKDIPVQHIKMMAARVRKIALRAFHVAAVVWAIVVLWSHVEAWKWEEATTEQASHRGCMVQFQAWHTRRTPCAVFQFNCHRRGQIAGTSDEVAAVFESLDRSALRRVVFSHCHALELPALVMHGFENLNSIATFNSTIHRWDASAKLSRKDTPTMAQIQFIDTNMTALPPGLAHNDLPLVLHLIIHRSNLSHLSEHLGHVWSKVYWSTLWLEHTQMTQLPASFDQLAMSYVSFQGTPIVSLSPSLFANSPQLAQLRLTNTPLAVLPDAPLDTTYLLSVLADSTKIRTVPTWLEQWVRETAASPKRTVTLRGSPVCSADFAHTEDFAALCGDVESAKRNEFPYASVAAQRPLD